MEWLTPKVTQYFQARNIWGVGNFGWTSGRPTNETRQGSFSGVDSPASWCDPYTVAWYAYFQVDTRAYDNLDENPNDENIYIQVDITTLHNKLWTSNSPASDGFIDIGLIAWDADRVPPAKESVSGLYLHDQANAKSQLYNWLGITDNNVICGIIADNGYKTGQTVPSGSWGAHVSGTDTPTAKRSFSLKFGPSAFEDDGSLKDSYKYLPFSHATRYHDNDLTGLNSSRTLDIDLSLDPFIYIPWAIKKSDGYVSCNRLENGLTVYKDGGWNHVVKNSILSRVINNKFPRTSNGFRIKNSKWDVSPITPSDD